MISQLLSVRGLGEGDLAASSESTGLESGLRFLKLTILFRNCWLLAEFSCSWLLDWGPYLPMIPSRVALSRTGHFATSEQQESIYAALNL